MLIKYICNKMWNSAGFTWVYIVCTITFLVLLYSDWVDESLEVPTLAYLISGLGMFFLVVFVSVDACIFVLTDYRKFVKENTKESGK